MKFPRLALTLLLIAGFLFHSACVPRYGSDGTFRDFSAFREARMKLPEKHEPLYLVAVGDIMLSRYVAQKIKEHEDPGYPFAEVKWFLQSGDIAFGNLEGSVTPGRDIKIPEMVLRADPCVAPALKDAGFDILSLANNHLPDFGVQGVLDTMRYLDDAIISHTGAGRNEEEAYIPRYMEAKGLKLAFLAFNDPALAPDYYRASDGPGTAALEPEKMTAAIREAAGNADFTVVYLHAGTEYASQPDESQARFARMAIDAGADLVLGSHPHVVQKVEKYRGKYILYSLGNFIFDQLWSRDTREGVAARVCISENSVEKIEFLPVYINDDARPVALSGQDGLRVMEKLGLELGLELIPAWGSEKEAFVTKEQYVFPARNLPEEYRLLQSHQSDLDGNGILEEYTLRDGRIMVRDGSSLIWQSPEDWWIDYFFLGDADNDGRPELNLSVWKEGSFGLHKPFWVKEEDTSVKNHLFIFRLEKGNFKPVWQSSNLDRPNRHAVLIDLDGDGENELVVNEGSYTDPGKREITLWKWSGWGFSRINH